MPAVEASVAQQALFTSQVAAFPAECFVWIDEVRCDRRNANRLYGRSRSGVRVRLPGYFLRGLRYSSVGTNCVALLCFA